VNKNAVGYNLTVFSGLPASGVTSNAAVSMAADASLVLGAVAIGSSDAVDAGLGFTTATKAAGPFPITADATGGKLYAVLTTTGTPTFTAATGKVDVILGLLPTSPR
jgi:hypothetical protein